MTKRISPSNIVLFQYEAGRRRTVPARLATAPSLVGSGKGRRLSRRRETTAWRLDKRRRRRLDGGPQARAEYRCVTQRQPLTDRQLLASPEYQEETPSTRGRPKTRRTIPPRSARVSTRRPMSRAKMSRSSITGWTVRAGTAAARARLMSADEPPQFAAKIAAESRRPTQ